MGDRANVYIFDDNDPSKGIYFYTHYRGHIWHDYLSSALEAGQGRWDDGAYLTRILATRMFADVAARETGGGISLDRIGDEYPILVVNIEKQVVYLAADETLPPPEDYPVETFKDFTSREHVEREPYGDLDIRKI